MSLVNQVLKDLQQRRTEAADTSGLSAARLPRASRGWARPALFGIGAVALGLALFAAERYWRPAPPPVAPATVVAPPPAEAPVEVPVDIPVEVPEEQPPIALTEELVAETVPTQVESEPAPEPAPVRTREPEVVAVTPTPMQRTLVTTTPQERAQQAYTAGVRALTEGQRGAAEARFREALGHDASTHEARLALANLLAGDGHIREAEVQLQEGLRIAPGASRLAERYARLLFERGDLGGAIGVLAAAPPTVDAQPDYHALLAALQQRAGNHDAAADTYAALVAARPANGVWWVGLAISLEAGGRATAAFDAYKHAVRDPRLSAEVAHFARERLAALEPIGATP